MAEQGEQARVLPLPQAPDAIELRHLRAFVAVAEELNFGRAASRLYLSQPALSRQIRGLERLIGCDLLSRSTHRVELTLAGESLVGRAREILAGLDDAVSTTRSVGGELTSRAAQLWKPVWERNDSDDEGHELAAAFEALLAKFDPPPEVQIRPVRAGGVPALRLAPEKPGPGAVLYLHGGGFVMGSAYGYRPLVGALSAASDTTFLVPDYALAPESPYPAALEDSVRAYLWLLDQGVEPDHVVIAGDSSGASLVLSVLVHIAEHDLPRPGGGLLLCPWVDLAYLLPQITPTDPQFLVHARMMRRSVDVYLAGQSLDDPIVNPLGHPEVLAGLPRMLIQAGTGDHLLNQAQALAERAGDQGAEVKLSLYPVATHDFHLFWPFLPEAMKALQEAGRFIRKTTT
ncbi:alpha/beta hydrolase fold domain-containing protein [Actinomadura barringtoniae]|uniref:Alpha/beta hydrolase fold domain-containing protein n=1 Tax=Actinomadura barringtoniae TaxID=1427535 RepID=A0A939PI56_9ACTN|nr:alpha/beta hydrolase fold domain-containing protein [Actinomadura barringtoniae]MBO2448981.1 alpha/beta hydrolase fold domain-containing protein [Actinomadura barringtoniae]